MRSPRIALVVVALALGVAAAQAASIHRVNHLSFRGSVSLPGVTLAAGTYTFETGSFDSNPSVVRVTTHDGRTVVYQGLTTPVSRPSGRVPTVMFGEAPAGRAMPIVAWYPQRSRMGHQFRY